MPEAKITEKGREKLCRAHAGDVLLPKLSHIAFGDGGINELDEVIPATGGEVALRNELYRMEIDSHNYPVPTTCTYSSELKESDLQNKYISEYGIFDEENDLIVYKTFLPKGKDDDMKFGFEVQEIF